MWSLFKKNDQPKDADIAKSNPESVAENKFEHPEPDVPPVQEATIPPTENSNLPLANPIPDKIQQAPQTTVLPEDDMTHDLGLRVMAALDAWRNKYHLESLPDKIALTQAINILLVLKNAL